MSITNFSISLLHYVGKITLIGCGKSCGQYSPECFISAEHNYSMLKVTHDINFWLSGYERRSMEDMSLNPSTGYQMIDLAHLLLYRVVVFKRQEQNGTEGGQGLYCFKKIEKLNLVVFIRDAVHSTKIEDLVCHYEFLLRPYLILFNPHRVFLFKMFIAYTKKLRIINKYLGMFLYKISILMQVHVLGSTYQDEPIILLKVTLVLTTQPPKQPLN